ncbi:dioxygenase family protein [Algisphaera agarilytica]|uniref:Protocatechuate 3,4-dioxygenase beta subunit n=1 Tax=Algisphaera agarilytica TaxID=1385975 RepID=A0A7X0H7V7_9BACT|nr:hypothetical protein [Algisphaera agarilytica]MBB6429429.1 protocatechuate 3,4-dioxygenase beta subunit [Algisphaera agarilytica]
MSDAPSRRMFLKNAALGLGVATAAGLRLRADAQPTEASGDAGDFGTFLTKQGESLDDPPANPAAIKPVTEPNVLGPYHRENAPYRAKITPPLEPGPTLLITGTAWGHDTQKPLPGVTIDIWQANAAGRYDNDDPRNPPQPDVFVNRARVLTDELGRYEYETIHPGAYRVGRGFRPPHIHYLVRAAGYQTLITQLYFRGDAHQDTDGLIRDSLIIDLDTHETEHGRYRSGVFDVVLAAK